MSVTNRTIPSLSVLAGAIVIWFLAVPQLAEAQKAVPRGGGDQQLVKAPSDGAATKAPSGGGQTSSGGGQSGNGEAAKAAPAQRRPSSGGGSRRGGGTAAPRDAGKSGDSGNTPVTTANGSGGTATPPYSRPRGDNAQTGQAVERRGRPPVTGGGGTTVWVPGGYYGGYYPWGYGGMGLGGYYGGYYDPWYYGDSQPYSPYAEGSGYDGQLRLKIKPREAEVYVDGYYAGLVDEFDGVFQRLRMEPGPHRIEVRADGYEPLVIDVRIQPDRTTTYTSELKEISAVKN